LSLGSPPAYGAFKGLNVSSLCSTYNQITYQSEYDETYILVLRDKSSSSSLSGSISYKSTCTLGNCTRNQYLDSAQGQCLECPIGFVSPVNSTSINNCTSFASDGLAIEHPRTDKIVLSREYFPGMGVAKEWRLFTFSSLVTPKGWSNWNVDYMSFYTSIDCTPESKINTTNGIAFSSGFYDNNTYWGPSKAFDDGKSIWLGKRSINGYYWIGMNFTTEVSIKCVQFFQDNSTTASELRLQAKPTGKTNWVNIWVANNLLAGNNTFSVLSSPTPAPIVVPIAPVPSPVRAPVPSPSRHCFSAVNKVEVKNGGYIFMSQLQIGDLVRSGAGEYTQVYGFGHRDHHVEATFLQIYFDSDSKNESPVEVSSDHLIFVERNQQTSFAVPASDVVVGDILSGKKVASIHELTRRGVYTPLTQSGDIIVNGIRSSNYINVLNHNLLWDQHILGHSIIFPQRLFCKYFIDICQKETYTDGYGFLAYYIVHVGLRINEQKGWHTSILVSVFMAPAVAIVYTLEFMGRMSWISIVITGSILMLVFKQMKTLKQGASM
jgi:Hint module